MADERRPHTAGILRERLERYAAIDRDTRSAQLFDQKSLVVVLREAEQKRERTQARAHIRECEAGDICAVLAQVNAVNANSAGDDIIGKAKLLIEFQRSRVNAKCARRLTRRIIAVDDAACDSMSRQP